MNKKLLYELAVSDGIYDCLCDPYDKFKTGDYYGSVMWDLERFAEKIIRECAKVYWNIDNGEAHAEYVAALKKHFGIEE